MSAIEPLGYPDWQRLTNWDGPVLWQPTPGAYNANLVGPVMRVDRYQSLSAFVFITLGKVQFQTAWYADQALTIPIMARSLPMDLGGGNQVLSRWVNAGPWCQSSFVQIGGGAYTLTECVVGTTNRGFPSEYVIPNSILASAQAIAIGAGANFIRPVSLIASGRAHLWAACLSSPGQVRLNAMDSTGVYTPFAEMQMAAGADINLDVELPQASVQMQLTNTGGVGGTYWGVLTGNGR